MKKWIIAVVIVGLLGYAVYDFTGNKSESTAEIQDPAGAGGDNSGKIGINQGEIAPDFELQTIDGETVNLHDYHGEKVILNFWATWCPPCRTEMPDMQKFHEETDATILAVNLTETEKSKEDINSFLDEYGITFSVLLDEPTEISELYRAYNLPTSYFINTKGEVHNIAIGAITYEMMEQTFAEMQ